MDRPFSSELASRISSVRRDHPVRVAIDGADASGKTTLADELAAPLQRMGRSVLRSSIDGFHNPATIRRRRGATFLRADFEVTIKRAEERDLELFGTISDVRFRYEHRYVPGQRLYLSEAQPESRASVVINNNDPAQPHIENVRGNHRNRR